MSDISQRNIRLIERFTDSLNAWDIETMSELSTDDILPFRPPNFDRETTGKLAYMEVLRQARDQMIDGSEKLDDTGTRHVVERPKRGNRHLQKRYEVTLGATLHK